MKPPSQSTAAPKRKAQTPRPGVERGDHVYVQHPDRGAMSGRVLARGRDGVTVECDQKQRHSITWDRVLGVKTRMLNRYRVVEQGGEGAILEDSSGRRRFLQADIAPEELPAAPTAARRDDPLLDETPIRKSLMRDDLPILFFKGGPIANRAGLHLEDRTDKGGKHTKRWVRQGEAPKPDAKDGAPEGEKPPEAPIKHGDDIKWRHKDVEGSGKVFASGADGVLAKDPTGRDHQVRHEHIVHPEHGTTAAERGEQVDGPDDDGQTGPLFPPEETANLPTVANQPAKTEAELFEKSTPALEHLREWLNQGKGLCDQLGFETVKGKSEDVDFTKPGGLLMIAPLKGKARAAEKVKNDYGGDWSRLVDTVRCTIAVDAMADLPGLVEALRKGGMKLAKQPKDRFAKPTPVGYRDMLLNIELPPSGVIGEMQLHVKSMLSAKSDGHEHYEVERTLDPKKKAGTLTPEEEKSYQEAISSQEAIYAEAWKAATGGKAPEAGQPMQKAMAGEGARFTFFDHDGAQYRRDDSSGARSVDDVLAGDAWQPYKGSDPLEPALFGDEIDDPLAGSGGDDAEDDDAGSGDGRAVTRDSEGPGPADAGGSRLNKALAGGRRLILFLAGRPAS